MNTTDTSNPKDIIGLKKPRLSLVPPSIIIWLSMAMANGAKKYGPYNWRDKKVRMMIYIEAAQRHLLAMIDGEDIAQDSQVHHAAHAAACCGIILDAMECNCLIDDRPLPGVAAKLMERLTIKDETGTLRHAPARSGKKKVYIAGPMRGIKDFNFPAFHAAEEQLVLMGYETFNPARRDETYHGAEYFRSETGNETDIKAPGFTIREALAADSKYICENADMVVLLPGWENSKGAIAEVALARAMNLEVKTLQEMFPKPSCSFCGYISPGHDSFCPGRGVKVPDRS